MFESIRRAKLQREGFSCGKIRRKHQEGDWVDAMRTHPAVAVGLYAAFFLVIAFFMRMGASVTAGLAQPGVVAYSCAATLIVAMIVHLRVGLKELISDNRKLALVLGTLTLHLGMQVAIQEFGVKEGWNNILLILGVPLGFSALVLSIMLGTKVGLFGALYATLIGVPIFVTVTPLNYLACSALIGFLAVALTRRVRRRNRVFIAGFYIGIAAAAYSVLLHYGSNSAEGQTWMRMAGVPFAMGMLTGMVTGGFLPMLESLFGVTTDISWLELADLNHPLMKRLSMEAPGTYHHSLMVASLSEAAAESIGANPTMCRVSSYFHDIGKLAKPEYFIENMDPESNPHDDLTARMSALVLIAHVKDGVDLAIKHNLNCNIIDVIEQHHGTSLVWYFYRRALDQRAEALRNLEETKGKEDDVPQVTEDVFRYPGPRPQFKESAIISLADSVESASRTLEKPNASRIETMVDEIVQARMVDGQLDECDLTIAELARVKASFCKTLLSMMHSRIKYARAGESMNAGTKREAQAPRTAAGAEILEGNFPPGPGDGNGRKRSNRSKPASAA
ncbi:MAG: HDIG domain-containing protein [Verrucomicrobiales bacterium]|nr:HDIG domain-containing protein [Verrucomicrobiales bacterium]MCP5556284.1 HDIG domain-containing protein [Verrucomicrobiaceae bacterium]